MSLLCRLKNLVHKGLLKKEDLDRIVIIPKEQENKVIKMRDATPEERESIAKYMNDISKQTVVNFWDLEKDTVHFDFELYQAGLMDLPNEMIDVFDKIRDEILEYIDDLDIASEICDIFDKYTGRLKQEG